MDKSEKNKKTETKKKETKKEKKEIVLEKEEKIEKIEEEPKFTEIPKGKRKKEESEEEDFEDDEPYIDEYQEKEGEELTVSFDINQPVYTKDVYGTELFTKNYLLDTDYNYVSFTEHLLGDDTTPNKLTNIIKVPYEFEKETEYEWNYEVYGLFSLLDLKKHKKLDFVKQIKKYILDHIQEKQKKTEMEEILDNDPSALIINERVVNLPINLAPHLHIQLFDEIKEKQEKDELSKFKNYIIITKVYEELDENEKEEKGKKKKYTPLFYKEEEELYYQESFFSYFFPIKNKYIEDSVQIDFQKNIKCQRCVMVVKRKSIPSILEKMKKMYDDATYEE